MTLPVWTLKDAMDVLDSKKLSVTLTDLQQYQSDCEDNIRRVSASRGLLVGIKGIVPNRPDEDYLNRILQALSDAEDICKEAKWESARGPIALSNIHLKHNKDECDWSSLAANLRTAVGCMVTAMWTNKFVRVSQEFFHHVNHDSLFGSKVKEALPSATDDIKEAGNCIAVDSGTAAVFHLMRAVEWGMRALAADLGVVGTPRKNANIPIEFSEWENILGQLYPAVEKKINALPPNPYKQESQEFYYSLLQDIRGFKEAFRNHIMHTRKSYNQGEASAIMDYVSRFLRGLSTRISE